VVEAGSGVGAADYEEAVARPSMLEVLLHRAAMCNDTGHSLRLLHRHRHCHQHCGLEEGPAVKAVHHEARL
jgi:hypothetical protein